MDEKKIVAATLAAAMVLPLQPPTSSQELARRTATEDARISHAIDLYRRVLEQLPD